MTDPRRGEFALIARLAPYLSDESGDDAAVLRMGDGDLCVAVDVVVEGVHFRRDLSGLADVGWKAVAVNASDLAAMGATPTAAVVGLCRPAGLGEGDVETLYAGMAEAGARYGVALVGGDTVAGEQLVVSVTALGEVPVGSAVRRSGARPRDRLVLVGALGRAAAALAQDAAGRRPDAALLAAHRRPRALVAAGRLLAAHGATAMIDLSDGLGADLGHLCAASGVGARVRFADLPLAAGVEQAAAGTGADLVALACGGGEDFALLAALPRPAAAAAAAAAGGAEGVPAAVIGEVLPGGGAVLVLPDGTERDLSGLGYEHYEKRLP